MKVVSLLVLTVILATASSRTIKEPKNISVFYRKSNRSSEAEKYFDGDIRLTPQQQNELHEVRESVEDDDDSSYSDTDSDDDDDSDNGGTGMRFEIDRWPKEGNYVIVPYVIDSSVGYSRRSLADMMRAITMIEVFTCVRFKERSNQQNYLFITMEEDECWSYVGRVGGKDPKFSKQPINFGHSCSYGSMAHEFIHALGFFHMFPHPDRDDYVKINEANIQDDVFKQNFYKLEKSK
jgi:hypothetical protein